MKVVVDLENSKRLSCRHGSKKVLKLSFPFFFLSNFYLSIHVIFYDGPNINCLDETISLNLFEKLISYIESVNLKKKKKIFGR